MSATEAAKCHDLEASAESSDAVNGGSAEEVAVPPAVEPMTLRRDTYLFYASSRRHTISPPLFLNPPSDPLGERVVCPPLPITEPRAGFFKRLKNKMFRRRSRQFDMPAPPKSKARPVVSRARQVIHRASSMNLFAARQRSQVEPVSSAISAHPRTRRARRRFSPVLSETPFDEESVLAFSRTRQRSPHVSNRVADTGDKESGPSTRGSLEQLNRRRNRMTVVAGNQTYVAGRPGQPLQWKWVGEAEDEKDGGDGWQPDKCSAPRSTSGRDAEAFTEATAQALARLTCSAPGEIRSEVSVYL
ncbi:MAG: hypothetical protein M1839_004244 [Geoglossum umbratile]|nr:MAG: hypothetical protein M1839_004244 [Geoglossum umbratile]